MQVLFWIEHKIDWAGLVPAHCQTCPDNEVRTCGAGHAGWHQYQEQEEEQAWRGCCHGSRGGSSADPEACTHQEGIPKVSLGKPHQSTW